MSRHRNVRSMRYSDEYDGYDDVYGHSVEEDYPMSPSDAAFFYDRNNRQPQLSSFLKSDDIQEEEDTDDVGAPKVTRNTDNDKLLKDCLRQIKEVVGNEKTDDELILLIVESHYNVDKALNLLYSKGEGRTEPAGSKPQRKIVDRRVQLATTEVPVVTVVSSPDTNVVKGFNVPEDIEWKKLKPTEEKKEKIPTPVGSPRGTSPAPNESGNRSEPRSQLRDGVKAEENYKTDRGDMKDQLHMVVTGHVDAGKSTLMGHVLYKLGLVNSKTMHKYEVESKKLGKQSFIYAWILDETGEERSRGITMDVGQSKFETKSKLITLLDAPGHKDFIPNMITGAAQADVALLVVDSTRGEFETGFESGGQTREHALLVRSLGVSQLCVVVNKLDTVDWNEDRFKEICSKLGSFLKLAGFKEKDVSFVPCSGLSGENLVEPSVNPLITRWYKGPCLVDVIDKFQCPPRPVAKPLRISVNDVYKGTGSGFCVSGRVETGMVAVGDKLLVLPQNEMAHIKAVAIDEMPAQAAYAGDYVNLTLSNFDQQNIAVGYILCDPAYPVPVASRFEARVVIFNITVPITRGYPVILHMQCLAEQAVIVKLVAQLHKNTGDVVKKKPRCLTKNSNAIVVVETSKPICVEMYRDMKELGRFMLRVGGVTIAAGLITKILAND